MVLASSDWLILKQTTKRNIHITENPADIRTGYLQKANWRSYRYINLLGEICVTGEIGLDVTL
jgi:hypothetical protein